MGSSDHTEPSVQVSYIKSNAIIHHQSDAAHKLFNLIDRYITNWVGHRHPSSIFLWSRSLLSVVDTLWMLSVWWNETPRSPACGHLSIIWQLQWRSPCSSGRKGQRALLSPCQLRIFWGHSRSRGISGKFTQAQLWMFVSVAVGFNVSWHTGKLSVQVYYHGNCRFMCALADEGSGAEFLCVNVTWTRPLWRKQHQCSRLWACVCVCVCVCACVCVCLCVCVSVHSSAWLPIHKSCWQQSKIPSHASERHRLSKWMRARGKNCIAASRCRSWIAVTEPGYSVQAREHEFHSAACWLFHLVQSCDFGRCLYISQ